MGLVDILVIKKVDHVPHLQNQYYVLWKCTSIVWLSIKYQSFYSNAWWDNTCFASSSSINYKIILIIFLPLENICMHPHIELTAEKPCWCPEREDYMKEEEVIVNFWGYVINIDGLIVDQWRSYCDLWNFCCCTETQCVQRSSLPRSSPIDCMNLIMK